MRDSARAAPWIATGRMRRADDGSRPEPQRGVFRLRRGCLIRSHVLDVVADRHQTIHYRPARRSYQPCRSRPSLTDNGGLDVAEVVTVADRIRRHARVRYIEPARKAGKKAATLRAGDVASEMGLRNRVPAVCSALGSKRFLREARLNLVERLGPQQSTATVFRYEILERLAGDAVGGAIERLPAPVRSSRVATKRGAGVGRRLFLVSCVKTKLPTPSPAKDLYASAWFRKARACVESTECPWAILSAEYGLLHPDEVIRPYQKTLNAMPVAERRAWAHEVLESMDPFLVDIDTVVFFAGLRYRELLEPGLREGGVAISVPMSGLRQGEQQAWLDDCLHD